MALQAANVSVVEVPACADLGNLSMEVSNYNVSDYNISCRNSSHLPKPGSRPKEMDAVRILLYTLIFLLSVIGNLLIVVVLVMNKRMRTVTNCFLMSLAISDLMMAIFCMPFTLIPNILEDFIFGGAMCKTVTYFMGISVSISTFSLVAIAIERYSAICNPLKSRAWQTRSHAYRVIAATWIISLMLMVPYPVFSMLKTFKRPNGIVAHMCRLHWPSMQAEQTWYVILLFTLFFIPGVVMIIAYGLISRELYRGMQFEMAQTKKETTGQKNGGSKAAAASNDDDDGCYQVSKKPASAVELQTLATSAAAKPASSRSNTSEAKLQAKKRVVRMLLVIVALFFVCWMPLYSANTWKAFDLKSAHKALTGAPISFIHLLSYSSACVNPIIYCFMNTRFRKALFATFACCCRHRICRQCWCCGKKEGGDDGLAATSMATTMATSASKISYTTVSTGGAY
ncbi:cholecystokinin receptor-like [Genypterus blacodes]|uniref:cholecystokinin receptor-like n=1 Tax=Genypterus blacodes TaxID=154954 RepID=UPI003F764B56